MKFQFKESLNLPWDSILQHPGCQIFCYMVRPSFKPYDDDTTSTYPLTSTKRIAKVRLVSPYINSCEGLEGKITFSGAKLRNKGLEVVGSYSLLFLINLPKGAPIYLCFINEDLDPLDSSTLKYDGDVTFIFGHPGILTVSGTW